MKKLFGYFLCSIIVLFLATTGTQATPVYVDNNLHSMYGSPYYFGDADEFIATWAGGNDNPQTNLVDLNLIIDDWNGYFDGTPESDDDYVLPYLAIATDDLGTTINDTSTTINVSGYTYLTVKYGSYLDLFKVDEISNLMWTSASLPNPSGALNQYEISHYRLWNPTSVPEPAVILLFGTGIAGIAVIRGKRLKK